MKKTARRILFTIGLMSLIGLIRPMGVALAQTSTGLTIAPARQQHELKPGESTTVVFKIYNNGDSPVVGTISMADFIVSTSDGTPQFLENSLALPPKYAAATWFKLPYSRMALPAHEKVEIQTKIIVPKNALPGGHYSALIFEPGANVESSVVSDKAGSSAVSPRLAALVYIVVPGIYEETALLTEFSAPKFSQNGPIDISSAIKNTSPVHIRPTGIITITNMFGDIVTNLSLDEVNIFPDSVRNYKNTIPTKWLIGRYRADLSVAYGTQGKFLTGSIFFTVFPIMLIIYLLVLILVIIIVTKYLNKRRKRHEQELEKEVEVLKKEVKTLEHKI